MKARMWPIGQRDEIAAAGYELLGRVIVGGGYIPPSVWSAAMTSSKVITTVPRRMREIRSYSAPTSWAYLFTVHPFALMAVLMARAKLCWICAAPHRLASL